MNSDNDELFLSLDKDTLYFDVFVGLTNDLKLTSSQALLISFIWTFQQKKGWCYAGQGTLAIASRTSIPTVNSNLRKLERDGYIERRNMKSPYGTVCWRLGPQALDRLTYVKERIEKSKNERLRNLKDNNVN